MNVFGTEGNDTLTGGSEADYIWGRGGNDTLYGGVGDTLQGEGGDNVFIATEAGVIIGGSGKETLISDYTQSNYGGGIHFRAYPEGLFMSTKKIDTSMTLVRFDGIDEFNVTGTQYNDILDGYLYNVTLNGGAGNDALYGQKGIISGGSGTDTLIANYNQPYIFPYGVHLGWNGESTVRRRDNGSVILNYDGIETFNVTGGQGLDYLTGQNGDDTFYGLANNDILEGGNGNDVLDGGAGNDILDGGAGNDRLLDVSGSDTLKGGLGDDYLYTLADTKGAARQLYGGPGADTFVVDLKGDINLGFDFNVDKLGDFVNAITLPENQGPDWKRLGIDVGFSALGAGLGAIPVAGPIAAFLTSLGQTGVDTYLDQEALEAQIDQQLAKADQAVKKFGTDNWGKVFQQGTRDTIKINDFQLGVDNILLPRLPDPNYFYQADLVAGAQGGVFLSVRRNTGIEQFQNIAFIANNYTDIGITDQKFQGLVQDLIQGSTIGTFPKTPIIGNNNVSGKEMLSGSFANDNIKANEGDDEVFGYYGDDVIQGGDGNDTIFGGSNQNPFYTKYESDYGNDGNDILSGGAGNDLLYGESGNDFLNGESGNDVLNGGLGNNTLAGGDGNDLLMNTNGVVDGGAGTDTLVADYSQMNNGAGVHVGFNNQNAIFSRLNGSTLVNYSNIEQFNVTGTQYADVLLGAAGGDTLTGGAAGDTLTGGAGADNFRFNSSNEGVDLITDFSVVDDTIQVSAAGFGGGLTAEGAIAANQFVIGASAQHTSDRFIYNQQTGALFFDIDGLSGANQTQIATLSTGLAMTNNDIFVLA